MQPRRFGRIQAASIHLLISLATASVGFALFWWVWYPKGMTIVAGTTNLLLLVIGVDLVLGPLLTLILYVPGKKGLYLDLTVIALLKVAALGYGAYVMVQTRPIFLVAMPDRLQLVSSNDIDDAELAKATKPEYVRRSWSGPVLVGARDPEDPNKFMELTTEIFNGGPEIDRRPEYYLPFADTARTLLPRARRLSSFMDSRMPAADAAAKWVARQGLMAADIAVVPIAGRNGTFAMLVDTRNNALLRVFAFHPGAIPPPPAPPPALQPMLPALDEESLPWVLPDYFQSAG